MTFGLWILFPALLAVSPVSAPKNAPLVCQIDALTPLERERHGRLADVLGGAIVERRELPKGFELALDLGKLPADSKGLRVCVVEVAEWVWLEARCCPFLDFGIDVSGSGGLVRLRLTGGADVKAFLKQQPPLMSASR